MNFVDAAYEMKAGRVVRRTAWAKVGTVVPFGRGAPTCVALHPHPEAGFMFQDTRDAFVWVDMRFTLEDVLADDWERAGDRDPYLAWTMKKCDERGKP